MNQIVSYVRVEVENLCVYAAFFLPTVSTLVCGSCLRVRQLVFRTLGSGNDLLSNILIDRTLTGKTDLAWFHVGNGFRRKPTTWRKFITVFPKTHPWHYLKYFIFTYTRMLSLGNSFHFSYGQRGLE